MRQKGFTIVELLIAITISGIASFLMVTAVIYVYGTLLGEQTKSEMVRESQVLLNRISDDLRLGSQILDTTTITDPNGDTNGPSNTWVTSDPANVLIITLPATDTNNDLVTDPSTGDILQHETVYYSKDGVMYRRLLANPDAVTNGAVQRTSCPPPGSGTCPPDLTLLNGIENLLFTFRGYSDEVVVDPTSARSVDLTVNSVRRLYGKDLYVVNELRATLRND